MRRHACSGGHWAIASGRRESLLAIEELALHCNVSRQINSLYHSQHGFVFASDACLHAWHQRERYVIPTASLAHCIAWQFEMPSYAFLQLWKLHHRQYSLKPGLKS